MRKKVFGFALSAMLIALCLPVEAQQQAKIAKIGELVFRGQDRPGLGTGRQVFRARLRELGYVDSLCRE